ncbi:MDR family MFS transporter [Nocardia sp. CA-135953]|uniref:MDR family MFS transporter n=1 Tax=Nocardia sp. CA-135953 TaxID=3239978 RepID=UPI003D9529DA
MNAQQSSSRAENSVRRNGSREIIPILISLLLALLLAMLDNTIVGPALPTIVGELGGPQQLSWVFTAFALTSAISMLLLGKVGDLVGHKRTWMASILVFLIGSALSGAAQNMVQLIIFRGVQGIGAGGLVVGGMAIMGAVVAPAERAKYQGLLMAVTPIALLGGPLAGGWITDNASWRWAFYVNLPLGAVVLLTVWFTLRLPTRERPEIVIDWWGMLLLAVWTSSLVLIGSWAGTRYSWGSWPIIVLAAVTVIGIGAFVAVEREAAEPVMPLPVIINRDFALAGVLTFVAGLTMVTAAAFLPQYQQLVHGVSATSSGLLLLPVMAPIVIVSIVVGQLISRTRRVRIYPVIGSAVAGVGMFGLAQLDSDTGQLAAILFMVVLGIGMGCVLQVPTLVAQNSVELRDMGAAMGVSTYLRTIGMSLGAAVLGTIYAIRFDDNARSHADLDQAELTGRADLSPAHLHTLAEPVQDAVRESVAAGISGVFWAGTICAAVSLVAALLLRDTRLAGREEIAAARAEAGRSPGPGLSKASHPG